MDIDSLLTQSLLVGAGEALDRIADELISLHDGWAHSYPDPSALTWLNGLIADAGWWSGRLTAAAAANED